MTYHEESLPDADDRQLQELIELGVCALFVKESGLTKTEEAEHEYSDQKKPF